MRRVVRWAALAGVGLSLLACAARHPGRPPAAEKRHSARMITRADIERSGATDAWDALKRAGTFMSMKEGRGSQLRTSQRGRSSILLSDEMMLVVDDVVQTDFSSLRQIPAQSIDWMKVLSGTDATFLYGTPGANGVIIVRTGIVHDL